MAFILSDIIGIIIYLFFETDLIIFVNWVLAQVHRIRLEGTSPTSIHSEGSFAVQSLVRRSLPQVWGSYFHIYLHEHHHSGLQGELYSTKVRNLSGI